jgi:hypothetical protein
MRNIGIDLADADAGAGNVKDTDMLRIIAAEQVSITGNEFQASLGGAYSVADGLALEGTFGTDGGSAIVCNVFRGINTVVDSSAAANWTFSGNRVDAAAVGGSGATACFDIRAVGVTKALNINNNVFSGCGGGTGIHYVNIDADNVSFQNNTFSGSTTISGDIIHLEGASGVSRVNVSNNTVDQMKTSESGIQAESGVVNFQMNHNTGFPILIDSGASVFVLVGNNCNGCGIVDNSGAVTKYVAGNLG